MLRWSVLHLLMIEVQSVVVRLQKLKVVTVFCCRLLPEFLLQNVSSNVHEDL